MKKTITLVLLGLLCSVGNVWADNVYSFGFDKTITDSYGGTLLKSLPYDGTVVDISSTYSIGTAYVTSASTKDSCFSIANDAAQNYDTYYLQIASTEDIKSIYLVAAVTGSTSGSEAVAVGWEGTPEATISEYQTFTTPGKGDTEGKEITINFTTEGIRYVRLYRKIKLDASTKTIFQSSSSVTIPSSASTYGVGFIKVTTEAPAAVAPSFTAPTVDQSVSYEVDEVVASPLSVTATGTPDPTLQWYSNTSATTAGATTLTGNTNSTYTPSTAAESELYYYCVATNSQGSATSPFFHVVVSEGICPDGISISGTKEYYVGDDIELTAALEAGNGAITYQWYKGGLEDANVLDGETSSTLTIASCALGDAGSYYCVASKYGCLADAESAAFPVSVIAVPSNNQKIFSLEFVNSAKVTMSDGDNLDLTSTYATITGGSASIKYFKEGNTNKEVLTTGHLISYGTNDMYLKLELSQALQNGDIISFSSGEGVQLTITQTDGTPLSAESKVTTSSYKYTVTTGDAIINATTIYIGRSSASSSKHGKVTITRPYTRSVTSGNWGTICLPYAVAASDYSGATFYSIAGKRVDGSGDPTSIVLSEEEGALVAGRPYIFQATSSTLSAIYSGDVASAGSYNGLIGSIGGTSVAQGMYIIYNNGDTHEVRKAGTGVTIGANKAYINLGSGEGSVPVYVEAGDAPGRLVEIPLAPNNATSLEEIESIERAVKFIQNGQLYITRGGVTYDALGRIVR